MSKPATTTVTPGQVDALLNATKDFVEALTGAGIPTEGAAIAVPRDMYDDIVDELTDYIQFVRVTPEMRAEQEANPPTYRAGINFAGLTLIPAPAL